MDIGANLNDRMFCGEYHGRIYHAGDLEDVIARSREQGVELIVVTVGCNEDIAYALQLCRSHENLYFTIGQHPTHAKYPLRPVFEAAKRLRDDSKFAFCGEMGLDYDRLFFAGKEEQLRHFKEYLEFFSYFNKPLFLHCRAAHSDFVGLIASVPNEKIVHSFTGTTQEMRALLDLGCFIGFTGCSLKEENQLQNARECPLGRMLIESDCPWCEIKPTHASYRYLLDQNGKSLAARSGYKVVRTDKFTKGCMVKARNEPSGTLDVARVVAALKGISEAQVVQATLENGKRLIAGSAYIAAQNTSSDKMKL